MSIQRVGEHLFVLSPAVYKDLADRGDIGPAFRRTNDGRFLMVKGSTAELSPNEICTIGLLCDGPEHAKNRDIKAVLSGTLGRHFGPEEEYQLVEFGAGRHPLTETRNFTNTNVDYHAVEIDASVIADLKNGGVSASTIDTIPDGTLRTDVPRVSAGVYMMHFWEPEKAAQEIKQVISQDGFFVGNYMTAQRTHNPAHAEHMIEAFRENGLSVSVVRPRISERTGKAESAMGSEFWVVSNPADRNGMSPLSKRFAETINTYLQKSVPDEHWMKQRTYNPV